MSRAGGYGRILLIGARGQLGWELARALATLGEVAAADRSNHALALDLADPDSIRRAIDRVRPRLIVNAAAYTAVDRAEDDAVTARQVNATAPGLLAEHARQTGAALVHYSTDYVFDGTKSDAYDEHDATAPLGVYGRTKLEGERAVQDVDGSHLIFRTSWVYGLRGHNFFLTMLRLAQERDELRVVDDQIGAPNWSRWLAQATAHVLVRIQASGGMPAFADYRGLYHLSLAGAVSWCGFAERIFALHTELHGARECRVRPIHSAQYPTRTLRPHNSRLSTDKLQRTFGVHCPPWDHALRLCMYGLERAIR